MPEVVTAVPDTVPESEKPTTPINTPAAPEPTKPTSLSPVSVKPNPEIIAQEQQAGKKLGLFTEALPGSKPGPGTPLKPDQQEKYADVLAWAQALGPIPALCEKGAVRELDDEEKMWLTRECLLRYLRATKWNTADVKKRLEATLVWRREYGVLKHTPEYIEIENQTGKQYVLGFDRDGRPCLYLNPAKQNTEKSPRQIQHLVFMLERVVDLMGPGQETLALLVDFASSTTSSNPNIAQGRQVLSILQGHYPERLGRALVTNLPWFVGGFFKIINPFIDPLTRAKLKFNEDMTLHVPASQLDKKFGGECDFEYDHSVWWPEFIRITKERRALYAARWKELGSKIGASELELKGGSTQDPITEASAAVEKLEVK
ncbi:CRAL/TRIO domain-containing protein [Choiromyces venosus 120613-1]|uniref:CRAL/TRIO domain-containing protein n=1 Tax=Choiromyces venosus 120613-1 TaxID=1336337 RepID=A0A3N4JAC9_9PEZI|nr:CRAL/TRIO domain-containing protein [Choiromyces venosus 120613-1]